MKVDVKRLFHSSLQTAMQMTPEELNELLIDQQHAIHRDQILCGFALAELYKYAPDQYEETIQTLQETDESFRTAMYKKRLLNTQQKAELRTFRRLMDHN